MNIARIIFGIIYLIGAVANLVMVIMNPEIYHAFADGAFVQFYREAWNTVVVPNLSLFIALTIIFEIALGLLFLISRRFLKIALIFGIIFCLGLVPFGKEFVYGNIPLALIQAFFLWKVVKTGAASLIRGLK